MSYTTETPNVDQTKAAPKAKIQTTTFQRRPFEVEGVQVTEENFEDIAAWCNGKIVTVQETQTSMPLGVEDKRYIQVDVSRPLTKRQSEAHVGDWILYASKGFKVYGNRPFEKNFVEKSEELFVTNEPMPAKSDNAQTVIVNNTVNRSLTEDERQAYLEAQRDAEVKLDGAKTESGSNDGPGADAVDVQQYSNVDDAAVAAVNDAYPAADPAAPETIKYENHQVEEPTTIQYEAGTLPPVEEGGNWGGHH